MSAAAARRCMEELAGKLAWCKLQNWKEPTEKRGRKGSGDACPDLEDSELDGTAPRENASWFVKKRTNIEFVVPTGEIFALPRAGVFLPDPALLNMPIAGAGLPARYNRVRVVHATAEQLERTGQPYTLARSNAETGRFITAGFYFTPSIGAQIRAQYAPDAQFWVVLPEHWVANVFEEDLRTVRGTRFVRARPMHVPPLTDAFLGRHFPDDGSGPITMDVLHRHARSKEFETSVRSELAKEILFYSVAIRIRDGDTQPYVHLLCIRSTRGGAGFRTDLDKRLHVLEVAKHWGKRYNPSGMCFVVYQTPAAPGKRAVTAISIASSWNYMRDLEVVPGPVSMAPTVRLTGEEQQAIAPERPLDIETVFPSADMRPDSVARRMIAACSEMLAACCPEEDLAHTAAMLDQLVVCFLSARWYAHAQSSDSYVRRDTHALVVSQVAEIMRRHLGTGEARGIIDMQRALLLPVVEQTNAQMQAMQVPAKRSASASSLVPASPNSPLTPRRPAKRARSAPTQLPSASPPPRKSADTRVRLRVVGAKLVARTGESA